jgi:hypothetical protein
MPLIETIVHRVFDVFMWMLIDPIGQTTFFALDGLLFALGIWLLWYTRDQDN